MRREALVVRRPVMIRVPSEAEALIRDEVARGLYASAEEAIATAVDLLDQHDRAVAPLRPADDAVVLRTDGNRFEETVALVVATIRAAERRFAETAAR